MEDINLPYITDYIRNTIKERDGIVGEIEKHARIEGYPIVKPEAAAFLEVLCSIKKPKRILEIGTAVGFSSLLMLSAHPQVEQIITIDRYQFMIDRAKINFERAKATDKITLMEGQAAEILPTLSEPFDFIFLDAGKAQYPRFLPQCLRLLNSGGIFITDNILCGGIVAGKPVEKRRDKTTVVRVNEFLNSLKNNNELVTAILPIGDGMSLCVKK